MFIASFRTVSKALKDKRQAQAKGLEAHNPLECCKQTFLALSSLRPTDWTVIWAQPGRGERDRVCSVSLGQDGEEYMQPGQGGASFIDFGM